jgi:hypothetical protein
MVLPEWLLAEFRERKIPFLADGRPDLRFRAAEVGQS